MSFLSGTQGSNLLTLLSFGGQAVKAFGQLQQSKREGEIFEFNAKIKQQEANLIREKAIIDKEVQREKARRSIAAKQAQFAGAGVISTAGSAGDVLLQTAEALELDILINQFNADVDELSALNEATFQLARAQSARSAGFINASSTLLRATPTLGKLKFKQNRTKVTNAASGGTVKGLRDQLEAEGALKDFGGGF